MSGLYLGGLLCLACGAAALQDHGEQNVRCEQCGTAVRMEHGIPILSRHWETLQTDIEAARRVKPTWYEEEQPPEQSSPWRHHLRKRREYVQYALRRHLQHVGTAQVERLLDLGCGDGNNLAWLSAFARHAFGSDYNLVRLVRAQRRNPDATIFAADVLEFPAAEGAFDVVFFNHVIEHIPDDLRALASVRRMLKPSGLLVLGTPNEGSWWWQWAYRRDPASLRQTDHCHFYTALTIAAKLRKAGFDVLQTHHLGWGPPDWNLDARIRRYRIVDDVFSVVGRALLPRQASSLYLLASRQ